MNQIKLFLSSTTEVSYMKRKSIILTLLLLLNITFGCKKINAEKELSSKTFDKSNDISNDILKTTFNDTLVILENNTVVLFEPNTDEIKGLKKKHGDSDFYIIADDVAGYLANITEQLDLKKIKYITTDKTVVNFKKWNLFVNKNQLESKWSIVYINKNKKADAVAPVNFDINNVVINSEIEFNKWYGKYDYDVNYGKIGDMSEAIVGYNIVIKKDNVTFSGSGYQTDFYYSCNLELDKDTLVFKYSKTIEGDTYNGNKNLPLLKMYSKDDKWYAKSKLIYSNLNGKQVNDIYVEMIKRQVKK